MLDSAPVAPDSPRLVLYTSRYCGFCYRVLATVKQLDITAEQIEVIDVSKAPARRRDIIRATGRRTVPVLRIPSETNASTPAAPAALVSQVSGRPNRDHGPDAERWLFESRDIVRYLHGRFADIG